MNDRILEEFAGKVTVAELCARTGRSVEDLVRFCSRNAAKAPAAARTSSPPATTAKPTDSPGTTTVETRTRAGRDAFDTALLGLLAGVQNGLSARDIAEETGASLPQIRSAITRLGKKVRSKGNTAARRYWART